MTPPVRPSWLSWPTYNQLIAHEYNHVVKQQLEAASRRARRILSAKTECRRPTVHLLGEAGAGKSTLKDTLGRGYFSSFFNVRFARGFSLSRSTGKADISDGSRLSFPRAPSVVCNSGISKEYGESWLLCVGERGRRFFTFHLQ